MCSKAVGLCPWCGSEITGEYIMGVMVVSFTCECAMRFENGTHPKHKCDEECTNTYDGGW